MRKRSIDTMKRLIALGGFLSLTACAGSIRRPVETTEAAAELEQVTHSRTNELNAAVSPDASAIAYEVLATPTAAPHVEIMSLKRHGRHASGDVEYTSGDTVGLEPAWKPDGSGVLFVTKTGRSQKLLATYGYASGTVPFVVDAGDADFAGAWPSISPGGVIATSIGSVEAYETGWPTTKPFDYALGVSDLPGADGVTLLGQGTEPAWSPDGQWLAFARTTGGHRHLFVARADGSDAVQVTEGPADDAAPAWSPDGTRIVFCSGPSAQGRLEANLFTIQRDGSGLLQLTEGDRFACRPSWGRDGFIYFHANATDRFHIWRVRPK